MTEPATAVERADWREAQRLAVLIADSFHDLPQTGWLVPDPILRRKIMGNYFRILVDEAMARGVVYVSGDRRAVAVWRHASPGLTRTPANHDVRLAEATSSYLERFRSLEKLLDERHPKSAAYHHLALLAVRPERQRRGQGTALLDHADRLLDASQTPAYVQAPTLQTVALLGQHGYVPMGPAINPPDGAPLLWPMWRSPQPARATIGTVPP